MQEFTLKVELIHVMDLVSYSQQICKYYSVGCRVRHFSEYVHVELNFYNTETRCFENVDFCVFSSIISDILNSPKDYKVSLCVIIAGFE